MFVFRFDATACSGCEKRPLCVSAAPGKGRVVSLHPQEALIQEARAFQQSEAFRPYRRLRQAAEHRIARLMQLGVRQARYFGRAKTLFQLILAATVANLTLVAGKLGLLKGQGGRKNRPFSPLWTPLVALVLAFRAWISSGLAPRPQEPPLTPVEGKASISWLGGSAARTVTNVACRPGS